jgi:hypothetical protein
VIDWGELAAGLRLLETPCVGRESARRLLSSFGSPQGTFEASGAAWREVVAANVAAELGRIDACIQPPSGKTLDWLTAAESRAVVTLGEPGQPQALLEAADPLLLLYAQGDAVLLRTDSVAIVGRRNRTRPARNSTTRKRSPVITCARRACASSRAWRSAPTARRTKARCRWMAEPWHWWGPAWTASTRNATWISPTASKPKA